MSDCILSAAKVEKSFGQNRVLSGIDLAVKQGEIVGLLGPSGAGKTTLIRLLTGELLPDHGQISLLGHTGSVRSDDFYRSVGIVFDTLGLFERLTCEQNLLVFARIHSVPFARVREALIEVGLQDAAKRKACHLSRGMRQRLAIARAVLHRPRLLFMDEPTSGLDPVNTEQIHRLIRRQREEGSTVLLSTHRMEEARKLCDRVLLLNQGVIAEEGSPAEICARYNVEPRIRVLLRDGREELIPLGPAGADALGQLMRENAVEALHTTEPSLEDVFLQIAKGKEGSL